MILRRLADSIRRQDWFTVLLEVVIVVIGVFIGIQVANWNEMRTQNALEMSYLIALHEDFGTVMAELESDIASYEATANAMTLLLEQSRKDAWDVPLATLNDAVRNLIVMEGTPIVSATYLNLTGSGDLAIIRSQEVKNAISSFFGKRDVIGLVSQTHEMQLVTIFQPYIISNLDYVSLLREGRGMQASDGFEPERIVEVLQTPEFRNVVAAKWDTVTDLRNLLNLALMDARAVGKLLSEEIERAR